MTPRIEWILWSIALVLLTLAAAAWRRAGTAVLAAPPGAMPTPAPIQIWDADSLTSLAESVVEKDLFRLERVPAHVEYDPNAESGPSGIIPQMRPPRPALVLSGILGGPPWQALIEGAPGRSGSIVLGVGDSVNDLRVRVVTRDSVILQGKDTTLRLGVRRSW